MQKALFLGAYRKQKIIIMPDISMCSNEKCELRKQCFRFTCKPSEYRQAYSDFKPYIEDNKLRCDYQIKLRDLAIF